MASLALAAAGRETGVVVDIGGHAVQVVPIISGKPQSNATIKLDFGSDDVANHMLQLLQARVQDLSQNVDIKETSKQ